MRLVFNAECFFRGKLQQFLEGNRTGSDVSLDPPPNCNEFGVIDDKPNGRATLCQAFQVKTAISIVMAYKVCSDHVLLR